jgi:hypothetical protein
MEKSLLVIPLKDILKGLTVGMTGLTKADSTQIAGFLQEVIKAKEISFILAAAAGMAGKDRQGLGIMAFSIIVKSENPTLYIIHENGVLISGALVISHTINRIGTLDTHRRRGYATTLLKCIEAIAVEDKWPTMFSPVDPEVIGLYEKVGWVLASERVNPDGTYDMKPKWANYVRGR